MIFPPLLNTLNEPALIAGLEPVPEVIVISLVPKFVIVSELDALIVPLSVIVYKPAE